MMDDLTKLSNYRADPLDKPLLGATVLVVEDSRFASEAIRLLCLRSGARIRRADCLRSARRHLRVYRPSVAIIDIGLPDGEGDALIAELAQANPRVEVILATSGDDGAEARALAAGADGYLAKPVASLAYFQQTILSRMPEQTQSSALRVISDECVQPDPFAFRDDMVHAAEILAQGGTVETVDYLAQFLAGVARAARDAPLENAAAKLARRLRQGQAAEQALLQISCLVDARISAVGPV